MEEADRSDMSSKIPARCHDDLHLAIWFFESCLLTAGNESRAADETNKHSFPLLLKLVEAQRKFTINIKNRFREARCEVLSTQPALQDDDC
jgi:hypothetical protein